VLHISLLKTSPYDDEKAMYIGADDKIATPIPTADYDDGKESMHNNIGAENDIELAIIAMIPMHEF
jgi:hypothetical protein